VAPNSKRGWDPAQPNIQALDLIRGAYRDLLAEKRRWRDMRKRGLLPTLRANYRVLVVAGRLYVLLQNYPRLDERFLTREKRSLSQLPVPDFCKCGCAEIVKYVDNGRPPKFAKPACRKRAARRTQANLPINAPRVPTGGRESLEQRLAYWSWQRHRIRNLLTYDLVLMRMALPPRRSTNIAQVRRTLRTEREWVGLREPRQDQRSRFRPEYFAHGLPVKPLPKTQKS